MPYTIVRDVHNRGYYVMTTTTGNLHSKYPLSKTKAISQLKALYLHAKDYK